MTMRPLAIVIGSIAHDRLHAALAIANSSAALGRTVSVCFHAEAVRAVDPEFQWFEDQRFTAGGLPAIHDLLGMAIEMGVDVVVCQSGMALTGMSMIDLDDRIHAGGLISFLGHAKDAELLLA